jgi:hypothetical protein
MLAAAYLIGLPFIALLGIVVVAGGGRTFGSEERLDRPLAAAKKISKSERWSFAVIAAVTAVYVLIPILTAAWFPAALVPVLVAETAFLSAILAIEGWREYGIFRDRFTERNNTLPVEPEAETRAVADSEA